MEERLKYLVDEITCMKHNIREAMANAKYCKQAVKDLEATHKRLGNIVRVNESQKYKVKDKDLDIGRSYYEYVTKTGDDS